MSSIHDTKEAKTERRPSSLHLSFEEGRLAMPESKTRLEEEEPAYSFDNRAGLAHDLSFLASMPELCDVTFLVGEDRHPVCGVKAVLAARSRVFRRMLYDEPAFNNITNDRKKKKRNIAKASSSDSLIDKYDFRGQPTITIHDFDPEVFKQLMEYIHTGTVSLQSRTLLGLMNAADHYGLDELKLASIQFLERAINTDTVCSLLSSAEKYIQYKSTKILVQKMLDFVDRNAEVVLTQAAFANLPQHVVRLVLGREELQACEETKFEAAIKWAIHFIHDHSDVSLKTAFEPFVSKIEFHKMTAKHLMQKVKPADVVDDSIILTALAYQADPSSIDVRRLNVRFQKVSSGSSTPEPDVSVLEHSPYSFRRVKSSGGVVSNPAETTDGDKRNRSGSVPPLDDNISELHPSRVFEIRAASQASELSLSSAESNNSLSSFPQSPTLGRSTSSSSYSNVSTGTGDRTLESIVTMSSASIEV